MDVRFATRAGQGGDFHVEHLQVILESARPPFRGQACFQVGGLGGDANRATAGMAVMAIAGRRFQAVVVCGGGNILTILVVVIAVAAQGHQHGLADGDGVSTQGEGLGDVGTAANAARDNQLHFAEDVHLFECFDSEGQGCEGGNTGMFDEDLLRGCCAPLHAVNDDDIRPRLDGEFDVFADSRGPHLDVDGDSPVGDFSQFVDFDRQVIGARPVGVPAGRTLVDPFRQRPHGGDARTDFLTEQHAATAGFGTLPDDQFDGVGFPQVVGIEAVTGREALIDKSLRRLAFFGGHAAVAGCRGCAGFSSGASNGLFGVGREGSEAHAGDCDGDRQFDGVLGEPGSQHGLRQAAFAITF